jgi:hypothetical protein
LLYTTHCIKDDWQDVKKIKVECCNLLGGNMGNHENFVHDSWYPGRDLSRVPCIQVRYSTAKSTNIFNEITAFLSTCTPTFIT